MTSITPATTLDELAFIVCTAFHLVGECIILSGGGAATVYAPDAYQSRDLDFVLDFQKSFPGLSAEPLMNLGFRQSGGSYAHPESPFLVEFMTEPPMVGQEDIPSWDTLRRDDLILHILSPTDCVRDRLAAFLWWNDFSALEQALAVTVRQGVDQNLVQAWCQREGKPEKYAIYRDRLAREASE